MSSSGLAVGIRHFRRKLALQGRQEESDERLLHAFTSRRDDSAFAALVHRHGPMVLNACRRVLGHEQDGEDAFQATFLVLARTAATLRNQTMLTSFLQGTAYRTAMKAKQSAARRRKREGSLGALTQPRSPADPTDELLWREVRTLLDEEIARLPEIYRSVFVLCCSEGVSREEAARRLQVKEGTVSSRLAEARKRLAQRLARRGVELTAVLAATAVATPTVSALPAGLMAKTMKAVLAMASGKELASVVSASVIELVQDATAMIGSKAKIATVVLLLVATSGSLVGMFGRASGLLAATTEPPAAKTGDLKAKNPVEMRLVKDQPIRGRVVNTEGKSVPGVRVTANAVNVYPNNSLDKFLTHWKHRQMNNNPLHGWPRLGELAGALFAAMTDAEGRFILRGLGVERFVSLRFTGAGIADSETWIVTRPGFDAKSFNKQVHANRPKMLRESSGSDRQLHGPDVAIVAMWARSS